MTFRPDHRSGSCDLPEGFNDLSEDDERCRLHAERVRLLHVHGALSWHGDVKIIGNRNALLVLRDAVDEAIESGAGATSAMVSDGEGFGVTIEQNDATWESPAWTTAALPYSDPVARGDRAPDPDWIIGRLRWALKQANAGLVKRGVRPVADPTEDAAEGSFF